MTFTIPTPTYFQPEFIPNPCALFPEMVSELPHLELLPAEIRDRVIEVLVDELGKDEEDAVELYESELSVCPGCKVGGGVHWVQSPEIPSCKCGREMKHLLTLSTQEFDRENYKRWCPSDLSNPWNCLSSERQSVQAAAFPRLGGFQILFICRYCSNWPIEVVFQR